ncbi:Lipopolysaccharide-modifying protein [Cordyceps militaris CM01]|uniref:Lipopolysaccharide-modifying protein n=1 Tax=Cordyceps militaris (strain CM01) TaxID=983644 RepID=G3JKN3_CORMM|nr:Lipopolysaccharide-modifying protein [Cordyceps militaris CM01]EGX91472.1 Lipopolysaccharide-modifying protein [Cordyceps militaris CM01]
MAQLASRSQDRAVAFAAATLLCELLTQRLLTRQTELLSEGLAWVLLPALVRAARRRAQDEIAPLAAASTAATSRRGVAGAVLFAAGIAAASFCRAENGSCRFYPALVPILLAAQRLVAAMTILDLFVWNMEKFIYASVALVSISVAYMTLLPQRRQKSGTMPHVRIEDNIEQLSKYVVLGVASVFIIQTLVFGLTTGSWLRTLAAAVFKCLTWFFAIQLSTAFRPLLHISLSALSLGQVVSTLTSRAKSRSRLWVFMLVALIPYGANIVAIRHAEHAVQRTFGGNREHPVDILMHGANAQFNGLLHRQSKSLEEAQAEYRRRYKMDPPPGFEAWYNFAVAHESPIIDEFDLIYKQVAPFLKVSGAELQRIMDAAFYAEGSEIWSCQYDRTEARARCNHKHRSYDRHISSLFEAVGKFAGAELPDVRFLVNHLDEPTVLLPSEKTMDVRVTDLSHQPTWANITQGCAARQVENSLAKDERESFALPFIKDAASATDICRHPEVCVYDSDSEPDFFEKTNNLYWAGSTSGAFAHDDGWRAYHRQRFVQFAQNLGREQYYYLQQKDETVERVASSFLNGRLYDVGFTRIMQCLRRQCRAQRGFFPPGAWADKDAALQSRLVFDLDGNGISGRYYKLLASKSLPLKQTLLREWHDERLVPWVHYVPVSQSLEELPELVLYLTSTASGQRRAEEMAGKGQDWHGKALRKEDMAVYVYRLMLELARLQDPNRQPQA